MFKAAVLVLSLEYQVCDRHWMIVLCGLQAIMWACESSRSR